MWKWRNKTIFEDDFQRPNDPTYVIIKMFEDIDKCIHHPLNIRHYDTIFIGWKRPREGWIKLNCDGAYKDSLGLAGCGGLFRDSDGRWIKGYSRKLGTCTWECSLLGDMVSIIFKWKVTQKVWLT
jgi:hypothetical protein